MELNIMDLDNILYVSRGYAPITVQLVEAVSSCMATTSIAGGGGGSQEKYWKNYRQMVVRSVSTQCTNVL